LAGIPAGNSAAADHAATAAKGEGRKQCSTLQTLTLGNMDYPALSALRERIDQKVREMREVGGPALLEKFAEEAAAIGMTIEEIVQTGVKRRGRPRKDREED
jgi:hypothetical protein